MIVGMEKRQEIGGPNEVNNWVAYYRRENYLNTLKSKVEQTLRTKQDIRELEDKQKQFLDNILGVKSE